MPVAREQTQGVEVPSLSHVLWGALRKVVKTGRLRVIDAEGAVHDFGDGTGPNICIRFTDKKIQRGLLLDPQLQLPEGYMQGRVLLQSGSLEDLLALFAKNVYWHRMPPLWQVPEQLRWFTRPFRQRNRVARAKRNVAAHYDLPDWLYGLFLDKNRQYSCGYFPIGNESLDEAQLAKMELIAKKLCLEDGHRVLDIGSGWGGLARYLAGRQSVDVSGITLSVEQLAYARDHEDASAPPLKGSVRFDLRDYRDVNETYDRIVSVGMFEHVGYPNYKRFFGKVAASLQNDGIALIHTIGRLGGPGVTNPFIAKYIFPGGYCPALSEIVPAIEAAGLLITDIEVLRLHYASTLAAWRKNFMKARDVVASRLSEEFCRMWEFYLTGCEFAFRYHDLAVFQIQLAKSLTAVPVTRNYLAQPKLEQARLS